MDKIDISELPKRKQRAKLLLALYHGQNIIRDGQYLVMNEGTTTYINFDYLSPAELKAIANFKKKIINE